MSEDVRRLPKTFEEDPEMFRWYTNEFKYNVRDKLDITEIIDIFTCEDISSHVRISYRFYQFVTTRYTTDFPIIEFQENFGGFLLRSPFQNGRKMLGDKAQTFHRLPFSLLLASNCFPRCLFCFLLPFVGWKNIPQQAPKTSSYHTYVTVREKVVCRNCCSKLINKSARVL